MSEDVFRKGDRITLTEGDAGWIAEVAQGKREGGRPGGIVQAGGRHETPEAALAALRAELTG